MSRARFTEPIGNSSDPAFVRLIVRAGITDAGDREPTDVDYNYWVPMWPGLEARGVEIRHPHYGWDRLIGWQAGGADKPHYGPFADPPNQGPVNGWLTPFVDVEGSQAPAGDPPPTGPGTPPAVQTALDAITQQLVHLEQLVKDADDSNAARYRKLSAQIDALTSVAAGVGVSPIYSGSLPFPKWLGGPFSIVLTPAPK
jgi:hypothetical protein